MLKKMKKALQYIKVRFYELKIIIMEFLCSSKLNSKSYRAFNENSLLLEAHSVEKGLGLKKTEPGHSSKEVNNLLNKLFYLQNNNDIETFAFRETFRIIEAYIEYQKMYDTSKFKAFNEIERKYNVLCERLGKDYINNINDNYYAGVRELKKDEFESQKIFNFEDFINTRHSVRMFENKKIEFETLKKVVEISNKAPSACNRQPHKIYFCNDRNTVNNIDNLITGSNGFKGETPNYIIVTEDRARFFGEEEFQWYINGGIYLSYLVLSLHHFGIGSCIMQWKAFYKNEKKLKELCGISKTEAIIAIVACGYYMETTKYICAQRKDVNETLHMVEIKDD